MNDRSNVKSNNLLSVLVIFLLTNYIYNDFEIKYLYGYLAIVVFAGYFIVSHETFFPISKYRFAFWAVIIPCTVFFGAPSSNKNGTTVALTISMLIFGCFVFFTKTDKKECIRILRWLNIVAMVISVYIIVVKFFPSLYWNFVYPWLGSYTQEIASKLLNEGYGVPIGGSATYADYIISISLFGSLSVFLFGKNKMKLSVGFVLKNMIYLLAILFENRRSEMIALAGAFLVLYFISFDIQHKRKFVKQIIYLLTAVVLMTITLVILLKMGKLGRYEEVFLKLIHGSAYTKDITGGRFALWAAAWELFKEKPLLGIGWEQFINFNTYGYDVHNTYLQWLCETGIVGFLLIFIPIIFLFLISLKDTLQLIKKQDNEELINTLAIIGLGMQLFFLIINVIDPAFYHLNYFCFFGLAVLFSESANVIRRNKKKQVMYSELKNDEL